MTRWGPYAAIGLLGVAFWCGLANANAFYGGVLANILIWTVATSGLNVIAGLGGYPSLVQGAFYGIGAYASTLALAAGRPLWQATLLAIAAACLAGLVVGAVFTRTRGQYFAIGTLFFGALTAVVLNNWASLTKGPLGLSVPFAWPSNGALNVMIALCAAGSLALTLAVARSPLGRRLRTIRADEDLAEHVGVPTARTKLAGFVLSAATAGLAGMLIAQSNGSISPDLFGSSVGFVMLVAVSIGGSGRVLGPLLGSACIVGIPDLLNLPSGIGLLLVGLIFIAIVVLVPGGLMSGADALARLFRRQAT